MESGLLVGGAVLLGFIALVLQLLWRILLGIVVFGPPSCTGVVIGHAVSVQAESGWLGFLSAIVVDGVLGELVCATLRLLRSAH